ncbi:MAG: hypothetical protein EA377_05425 [Phycisphaerales bacterium]|nr:MAG: hypothetical protein EA377_05425 [Phycisphaerales bacterium]
MRIHSTVLSSCALAACLSSSLVLHAPSAQANVAPNTSPQTAIDDRLGTPVSLPITRAVLFASGVGYFEHTGTVQDDAVMRLNFREDQINDILKSMVLMDLDGGSINSVNYAANDPLERTLKSFGVDLSGDPTLAELLADLRGAEIMLNAPDRITGRILNVETRTRAVGNPPQKIDEPVLNLVTNSGIRSVPLSSADSIQLADARLQEELDRALFAMVSSRDTEQKAVDIRFIGEGERRVRIGYLIETPVWKTSYRLDMTGDEPLLQGWAIVENTMNDDWKDVRLSLVSGRPISFVQDLYTPLYLARPVVRPQLFASLRPKSHDRAAPPSPPAMDSRHRGMGGGGGGGGGGGSRGMLFGDSGPDDEELAYAWQQSGVESVASGSSIGELFSYDLRQRVTMPRRRSAMLPIINDHVEIERLSVYNADALKRHPLNAVEMHNKTDQQLMAGPVTIFDDGMYAGDAQFDHLAAGEKRLLSYAIDLDVTVNNRPSSSSQMTQITMVNGIVRYVRSLNYTQEYQLTNAGSRDRTVVIEHPITGNADLIAPESFREKTDALYRFEVQVPAGESKTLAVREHRPVQESIRVLNQSPSELQQLIRGGTFPKEIREVIERAIEMKSEINVLAADEKKMRSERDEIMQGQARLRENLQAVGADTNIGKRYLNQLMDEEDRIEELQRKIREIGETIDEKDAELRAYLRSQTIR